MSRALLASTRLQTTSMISRSTATDRRMSNSEPVRVEVRVKVRVNVRVKDRSTTDPCTFYLLWSGTGGILISLVYNCSGRMSVLY